MTNDGGTAVTLPYLLVGARTSTGANVDFPPAASITLEQGQSYTYQGSQFLAAGTYAEWPAYYDGTTWHELAPHSTFTVTA